MKAKLLGAAVLVALSLVGCTSSEQVELPEEEVDMSNSLTWQEAKASSQAMEIEIAGLIPQDLVVDVTQKPQGVLLSCSATEHSWNGRTIVHLKPGTEVDPILRNIQAHYSERNFEGSMDLDVMGDERLQLVGDTGESYLIGFEATDALYIASSSACFTLPDNVYPGGNF